MTDPTPPVEPRPGIALAGRYVLDAKIGTGGAGVVWRAHDDVLHRWVALKVLHPQLADDPTNAARFRVEATSAARLTHPNAVVVFDIGRDGGRDYLVMELVDGTDLTDVLERRRTLDPPIVAHVGRSVAAALGAAHHSGLVHRDVKPGNVLLTRGGVPKVADFGIARAVGAAMARLTHPGNVMGTARYVAPEQLRDEPLDGRADVYALGLVLHEMLTGQDPWGDGSATEVAMRRLSAELPAISAFRDDVPPGLEAVIATATRRDPADRYEDGAALAAGLLPFVTHDAAARLAALTREAVGQRPRHTGPTAPARGATHPSPLGGADSPGTTGTPRPSAPSAPPGTTGTPRPSAPSAPPGSSPAATSSRPAASYGGLPPPPAGASPHRPPPQSPTPRPVAGSTAPVHPSAPRDDHTRVIGATSAEAPPPSAGRPRRRRGWVLGGIAVAIAATVGILGMLDGSLPMPNPTVNLSDVQVADVGDHDPLGDGGERPDLLGQATDGDPDTYWQTDGYFQADLIPPNKDGVGIWFDLGESHDVRRIELDLVVDGGAFEVWAGDSPPARDAVPSDWGTRVAEVGSAEADQRVTVDGTSGQVWLLWFTELPPSDGDRFRAHVADVRFRAR